MGILTDSLFSLNRNYAFLALQQVRQLLQVHKVQLLVFGSVLCDHTIFTLDDSLESVPLTCMPLNRWRKLERPAHTKRTSKFKSPPAEAWVQTHYHHVESDRAITSSHYMQPCRRKHSVST